MERRSKCCNDHIIYHPTASGPNSPLYTCFKCMQAVNIDECNICIGNNEMSEMYKNSPMQRMTPKETAQELISDYRYALSLPGAPLGEMKDMIAKQCALICVQKIEEITPMYLGNLNPEWTYWNNVKEEIIKF